MDVNNEFEAGRPQALHTISDADKAAAITAVCKDLSGQAPETRIELIDYNGRLGSRGPFRHYAEIRFGLFSTEGDDVVNNMVDALQKVDDATLADAIAERVGKLAGEDYVGYIAMKRIGRGGRPDARIADVRIQLATG